jgi:hypothetical protein
MKANCTDLHCSKCGNADPRRFATITEPRFFQGQLQGHTVLGWRCDRCGAEGLRKTRNRKIVHSDKLKLSPISY